MPSPFSFDNNRQNWDPGIKKGRKSGLVDLNQDRISAINEARDRALSPYLKTSPENPEKISNSMIEKLRKKFGKEAVDELFKDSSESNNDTPIKKVSTISKEAKEVEELDKKIAEVEKTLSKLSVKLNGKSTLSYNRLEDKLDELKFLKKEKSMPKHTEDDDEVVNAHDFSEGDEHDEDLDMDLEDSDIESDDSDEDLEEDSNVRDEIIESLKNLQIQLEDEIDPEGLISELEKLLEEDSVLDDLEDASTEAEATEDDEVASEEEDSGMEPKGSHARAKEEFSDLDDDDFSELDDDEDDMEFQKSSQIPMTVNQKTVSKERPSDKTSIQDRTRHSLESRKPTPQDPPANKRTVSRSIPERGRDGKLPAKLPSQRPPSQTSSFNTSTLSKERPTRDRSFNADKNLGFEKFAAELVKVEEDINKTSWTLFGLSKSGTKVPLFRVYAASAFPNLKSKPADGEISPGKTFRSYYHAFCDSGYGRTLELMSKNEGFRKTAGAAKAVYSKTAKTKFKL